MSWITWVIVGVTWIAILVSTFRVRRLVHRLDLFDPPPTKRRRPTVPDWASQRTGVDPSPWRAPEVPADAWVNDPTEIVGLFTLEDHERWARQTAVARVVELMAGWLVPVERSTSIEPAEPPAPVDDGQPLTARERRWKRSTRLGPALGPVPVSEVPPPTTSARATTRRRHGGR